MNKSVEETQRVIHGCLQHIGHRPTAGSGCASWCLTGPAFVGEFDLQNMMAVTPPVAVRAADKDVAEKLHLDFLETGPATAFALAHAGVKAEGAAGQPTL